MINAPDETPTPHEPPPEPGERASWHPEDMTKAVDHARPPPPPRSGFDGCLEIVGKIILTFFIGIFVIGGLIFATCFLGMQR